MQCNNLKSTTKTLLITDDVVRPQPGWKQLDSLISTYSQRRLCLLAFLCHGTLIVWAVYPWIWLANSWNLHQSKKSCNKNTDTHWLQWWNLLLHKFTPDWPRTKITTKPKYFLEPSIWGKYQGSYFQPRVKCEWRINKPCHCSKSVVHICFVMPSSECNLNQQWLTFVCFQLNRLHLPYPLLAEHRNK